MSDISATTAGRANTVPSTPSAPAPGSEAGTVPATRKRRLLLAVLGTFVLAGVGYFVYWLTTGRYVESTDDAYVSGNMVQITPQVAGIAVAIAVDDTQSVRAGRCRGRLSRW
jgi:membrane fusion protein (multidrug efflux system)